VKYVVMTVVASVPDGTTAESVMLTTDTLLNEGIFQLPSGPNDWQFEVSEAART
jgi:hypothetical protein